MITPVILLIIFISILFIPISIFKDIYSETFCISKSLSRKIFEYCAVFFMILIMIGFIIYDIYYMVNIK